MFCQEVSANPEEFLKMNSVTHSMSEFSVSSRVNTASFLGNSLAHSHRQYVEEFCMFNRLPGKLSSTNYSWLPGEAGGGSCASYKLQPHRTRVVFCPILSAHQQMVTCQAARKPLACQSGSRFPTHQLWSTNFGPAVASETSSELLCYPLGWKHILYNKVWIPT